jgi:hypothetical protein
MAAAGGGGFGIDCIVTVNPARPTKDTALLCSNNTLGLGVDDFCWVQLPEGKRYFKVETRKCASVAQGGPPPIELYGPVAMGAIRTQFGSATKGEFEGSKLKSRNALAAARMKALSWLLAAVGTLNAAKFFDPKTPDSYLRFDQVALATYLLLAGSLVAAYFDWRTEQKKDK